MTGAICLQGGAEFSAGCRDLDLEVLATAPIGPVVVLAGAAAPGAEYDRAAKTGVRWFRRLTDDGVAAVPDPRHDEAGALAILQQATMIVLPGGSPSRLREMLQDTDVGAAVVARWQTGATICGASAGAMVMGERVWLPDVGRLDVGLGLVPGLVIPHHAGGEIRRVDGDDGSLRWGLPECGGVLVADGSVRAVGVSGASVARDGHQVLISGPAQPIDRLPV